MEVIRFFDLRAPLTLLYCPAFLPEIRSMEPLIFLRKEKEGEKALILDITSLSHIIGASVVTKFGRYKDE